MTAVSRRDLIGAAAGLAACAAGRPASAERHPPVDEIYGRSIVLDTLSYEDPGFDVGRALRAGLTGVVMDVEAEPRDTANTLKALDEWAAAFAIPGSRFHKVLRGADFAEAKRLGKFAIVLNSQDAAILGPPMPANGPENIDRLRDFHARGLRVLQLTYTTNNGLGGGYADLYDGGLARLGLMVVEEMGRLGMLIDTSHCAERTTLEAIRRASRPVAVTHAGCFSLFPDKRNKSDAVIRALADRGGYMGIYNMTLWMTNQPAASVETIVDHIDHAVKVGGIDLVGFGSDHEVLGDPRAQSVKVASMQDFAARNRGFPGGEMIPGHVTARDLDGPDRLHVLARALARRGYRGDAIEKILGANFIRVFTAACG